MRKIIYFTIITTIIVSIFPTFVFAQDNSENPIYIVQAGENLITIANKFDVDLNELIIVNNISDSNLISEGTQLIIPGLEGISGILSVSQVAFGEDLQVILQKYQLNLSQFLQLNKITSPAEIYIGSNLVLPVGSTNSEGIGRSSFSVTENSSVLAASVLQGVNPWIPSLAAELDSAFHSYQIPGKT